MSIVHISGRIGRDAEVRNVNDQKVANFSVAENIGFGENKKTQWWSCALWGKRGESLAPHLTKGSAVTVCGEVSVREYDGKDGSRKHELTCRVLDVALQGSREHTESPTSRSGEGAPPSSSPGRQEPAMGSDFEPDEALPF
jgi:single-strand DNA-binding protein